MASGDKKILKNTLLLYARMGISMLISLYTSRVILLALGITDFGIYTIVTVTVSITTCLNGAMMQSIQRFLNISIGQKDIKQVEKIFSVSQTVYFFLTGISFLTAEIIGTLMLNNFLQIPHNRIVVANIVFQCSIFSTCAAILTAPIGAVILSYERFTFFAWINIIHSFVGLGIAILLKLTSADKLLFLSGIGLVSQLTFTAVMVLYFVHSFGKQISFHITYSPPLLKKMGAFFGWSLLGTLANMSMGELLNILLNRFFGVIANTAMGIANRVNGIVIQFTNNIQLAFSPQLVQRYAANCRQSFIELIYRTSKFSFLVLLFPAIPLLINTEFVLTVWLVHYPQETLLMTKFVIISSLLDALSNPLWMSVQATGEIKKHQIITTILCLSVLPISALTLFCGGSMWSVLLVKTLINAVTVIWRIFFLKKLIQLHAFHFFLTVFCRTLLIGAAIWGVTYFIKSYLHTNTGICFVETSVISCCLTALLGWFIGLDASERQSIIHFVRSRIDQKILHRNTKNECNN